MSGWVKLHRKMMQPDSSFMQLDAFQKSLAIHIIVNANHKDSVWLHERKNMVVQVKRGQIVVSRSRMMQWFLPGEATHRKVRTALKRLEKLNFLALEPTKNYTLITVVNYGCYQSSDEAGDQRNDRETTKKRPTRRPRLDPKQEVEEVKNEKKLKKIHYGEFVTMTESEFEKLKEQYGPEQTQAMIDILNNYKGSTGKGYVSDYRAILSWVVSRWLKEKRDAKSGRSDEKHDGPRPTITQGRSGRIRPGQNPPVPHL